MALRIRPAAPGDAGLVLSLIRELADFEQLADKVVATQAMVEAALFGAGATLHGEIAEWDGEVAGQALWFTNFSTFRGRNGLYLEDLYVRPRFRGRGVGKALLAHLARQCVARGWPRMEWVVLDWNQPAIEFYRSLGADLAQDWRLCRLDGAALAALAASD
ncbi:MAG: GNAT family N-acetyltransferase [Pseudomonadota bacterium]|nr:GNAT family N-acetyltransferase [Pseudomonadota bacterium]